MIEYDSLKASDGTGNAVLAHITAPRSIGGTVITVDSVNKWPTNFIVTTGTLLSDNFLDPASITEMTGHLNAGTIVIDDFEPGYSDAGNTTGQVAILKQTTGWANSMVENAQVSHNDDGTLKVGAVRTALDPVANVGTGWNALGYTPNTVTANGNRSYSLVFNSVDLTSVLSPGMRLRLSRTVTAPTQCTDLESGSSQYYSKTSPAGMTFTDDFVVSAWVKLESYPSTQSAIASRYNGTSGWSFRIETTGQVQLIGYNAAAGNNSLVQSAQALPLGRWVHVTAQLDMSAFTATTTTSYMMFDGVDTPATVSRAGSNPTALIQAGDLQIGAANGAIFWDGKLAQVAIFSAKVTQATIRTYLSQGLSGAETSLISAYSFNNSIADLNANANNLTAQGSAVATNADTPFTQIQSGITTGTTNFGVVTAASFSTNTTLTVQVPEGGTIPTSGGVSAVAYSVQKAPYGFPADKGKWDLKYIGATDRVTTSTSFATFVEAITVPIGAWEVGYKTNALAFITGTNSLIGAITLSADASTETHPELTSAVRSRDASSAASSNAGATITARQGLNLAVATTFTMMGKANAGSVQIEGTTTALTILKAEFNLL